MTTSSSAYSVMTDTNGGSNSRSQGIQAPHYSQFQYGMNINISSKNMGSAIHDTRDGGSSTQCYNIQPPVQSSLYSDNTFTQEQ